MFMSFKSIIEDTASKIPELALERLLRKKLKDLGVRSYRAISKRLASHIIERSDEEFHVEDDGLSSDLSLELTSDDISNIEKFVDQMENGLSKVVQNLMDDAIDKTLDSYRRNWHPYRRAQERSVNAFKGRIEDRWGPAFDETRILLDLCLDEGEKYHKRLLNSKNKRIPYARHALAQLHVRACQVAREVMILMENGFADGAMARWRTLHELRVIMLVIQDGGNELARRYLAYQAVDLKKGMDLYERDREANGYVAIDVDYRNEIHHSYKEALSEFGSDFKNSYGWAARYVGHSFPKFAQLEERAGAHISRSDFKLASFNVHASSAALLIRLGSLKEHGGLTSAATNAGFESPGINLCSSILHCTYVLQSNLRSIENMILIRSMIEIRDNAALEYVKAADNLREDHEMIFQSLEAYDLGEIDLSEI
jgi:hypothetical protein